jgi:1-acyl-sn-glycerol-3-phosphate acyltransferase
MSFEKQENENNNLEKKKETTPRRLMLALEALLRMQTKNIEINGLDQVKSLPPDSKVIVATTHLSDLDVPLATYALGNELNLVITNESVHHHLSKEADTNIGLHIAGKKNFIPIDYEKVEGEKKPRGFNPDNFTPMVEALEQGKGVVIASQNPSPKQATNLETNKGGYGAVYLAEISDAYILPVAIEVISDIGAGMYENRIKTFIEKPNIGVHIGSPIKLEKIEGIERLAELIKKHSENRRLTTEEFQEFSRLKKALEQQSQLLVAKLSDLLPEKLLEKNNKDIN